MASSADFTEKYSARSLDVVIHAGQNDPFLHVDSETAFFVTQFRKLSTTLSGGIPLHER